ncbi:hypothetical protein L9F63_000161, partial [Diploptera punctata]
LIPPVLPPSSNLRAASSSSEHLKAKGTLSPAIGRTHHQKIVKGKNEEEKQPASPNSPSRTNSKITFIIHIPCIKCEILSVHNCEKTNIFVLQNVKIYFQIFKHDGKHRTYNLSYEFFL